MSEQWNSIRFRVFSIVAIFVRVADGDRSRRGACNGLVTDPKDAIVVGVRVLALSVTQGVSHSTVSTTADFTCWPICPPGTRLTIEQPGFAANEFKGIVIEAGRSTTVDAKLADCQRLRDRRCQCVQREPRSY